MVQSHISDDWNSEDYSTSRRGGTEDPKTPRTSWLDRLKGDTRPLTSNCPPSGTSPPPPVVFCHACYYCERCNPAPAGFRDRRTYRECPQHRGSYMKETAYGRNPCRCELMVNSPICVVLVNATLTLNSSRAPQGAHRAIRPRKGRNKLRRRAPILTIGLSKRRRPRRRTTRMSLTRSPVQPVRLRNQDYKTALAILIGVLADILTQPRLRHTARPISNDHRPALPQPHTINKLLHITHTGLATLRHTPHRPAILGIQAQHVGTRRLRLLLLLLAASLVRGLGIRHSRTIREG